MGEKKRTWNARPGVKRFVSRPLAERFWEKVDRSGGDDACWIWLGAKRGGYGTFVYNGRTCMAHRVSWEFFHGRPMADGLQACHSCHNRICCNPRHVREDTASANIRETVARGTHNPHRGTDHPSHKLDDEKVREIRARHARGEKQVHLARAFGVSTNIVSRIVKRAMWKHVA